MRAQVSTEYIVILAVVLVLALTIVYLLGQTTGTDITVSETQSQVYWSSQRPISIVNYRASSYTLTLELKNRDTHSITITDIEGTGLSNWWYSSITLARGESITTQISLTNSCNTRRIFEYRNITFTYNRMPLTGLKQVGTIPLTGTCS